MNVMQTNGLGSGDIEKMVRDIRQGKGNDMMRMEEDGRIRLYNPQTQNYFFITQEELNRNV